MPRRRARAALAAIAFAAALAAALAAPGPVATPARADDAPAAPADLTTLADDALLERARTLVARLADAEKAYEAEAYAIAAGAEIVETRRAQVAAAAPPDETPPPPPEGASAAAIAKAAEDRAAARRDAFRERVRLIDEYRGLLEARQKRIEAGRAALKALETAIGELQPVANETRRRVAAGRLAAEAAPAGLDPAKLAERLGQLAEVRKGWVAETERLADAVRALPARIEQEKVALREAEGRHAAAVEAAREAQRREAIEKEVADKDPGALSARLAALEGERERLAAEVDKKRKAFRDAQAAVAAAEAAFERAAAPNPDQIALEGTVARVRAAEKAWKLAGAIAAFHGRRADQIDALKAGVTVLGERATEAEKEAAALDDHLLRTLVHAEAVGRLKAEGKLPPDPLPSQAEPEALAASRRAAAATVAEARAAREAAKTRSEKAGQQAQDARTAEKVERDRLKGLREAYESARENARWTREVEALETPQVVARFEDAVAKLAKDEADLAVARSQLDAAEAARREAEARLRALEDPIYRRARQQNPDERRRIAESLYRAAGREPPAPVTPEGAAAPSPGASAGPGLAPGAGAGAGSGAAPAASSLAAGIEARQNMLASRVRVLEERARERTALLEAIRREAALVEALAAGHSAAIDRAHRAYGAALELEGRVGSGALAREALPAGVAEVLRRQRTVELETGLTDLRRREVALRDRTAAVERWEADQQRLQAALTEALGIAGRKLDALRERAQLESRFERAAATTLSDAEKKRTEQEILRRIEETDSWIEVALSFFRSERAEELTDVLKTYYGDLFDLERKLQNLAQRRAITQRLIRLVEDERKVATALIPLGREQLVWLRAEAADVRIRTGLVSPTDEKALAALKAANREPPAPEAIPPDGLEAAVDRIFEARMRVLGVETWIRELEHRLSRAGIDADKGLHQDELGALGAKEESVKREVERLTGRSDEALAALAPEDRPSSEAAERRFLAGEIGHTRALRRSVLWRTALFSTLSLIIIPIVALYLVRAGRYVGQRIVKRVREDGDPEGAVEREQRAHTLFQVFKATWTGIVWVVAGIYMLKQLSVDVTPIIASAGVAGLALAFGAQTLIRDFFAGFFMLLENQYKIGDVIQIGDVGGVVERITLRLTVLRDIEGKVHFIPNGSVQRVTNMTKGWSRAVLEIGVAYKEDVDRVMSVLREVGQEMYKDPACGPKLIDPPEVPGVERFGDSSVNVRMMLKTRPAEQWTIAREARRRIKRAFDERGIEIPFPQRVVYHVYPEGGRQAVHEPAGAEAD